VRMAVQARLFTQRWCLYSSLVVRDLTLRSAPSFGSVHLVRLMLDEFLLWLVERIPEQVCPACRRRRLACPRWGCA
jgi:hypothetical protein